MIRHYLLLAAKVLLRRKFFTFISLFGIAFTLIVLVVAAAVMDRSFGPSAPETRQDRTLQMTHGILYNSKLNNRNQGPGLGYKLLDRYARNLPGVEHLSIFSGGASVASFVGGQKIELRLKRTDGEFWSALDFTFLEGRPFTKKEVEEAAFVIVLSASLRERLLGKQPLKNAVVEIDGQRFRVVGVVDDVSPLRAVPYAEAWAPLTTSKTPAYRYETRGHFQAIAVAIDRGAMTWIHDEFNARLSAAGPVDLGDDYDTIVAPLETKFQQFARTLQFADYRNAESHVPYLLAWIIGMGVCFALLPTVNLVNINMSRILERSSEIGVRKAFGASSRTLVFQFVVENVVLSLIGAVIAFFGAQLVLESINRSGLVAHLGLTMNHRVFLWGVAFAVGFGILSGVYPAWRMSRLRPVTALKGSVR